MVRASEAHVVFLEQRFGRVLARQEFIGHQQQVDIAVFQRGVGRDAVRQYLEGHPGGNALGAPGDLRHQHCRDVVRHHYPELAPRGPGIEIRAAVERGLGAHQQLAYRLRKTGAQRRRYQIAPHLGQYRVVEVAAQPRQRTAHRRLAQVDALAGAGGVLLGQQCIERYQ